MMIPIVFRDPGAAFTIIGRISFYYAFRDKFINIFSFSSCKIEEQRPVNLPLLHGFSPAAARVRGIFFEGRGVKNVENLSVTKVTDVVLQKCKYTHDDVCI